MRIFIGLSDTASQASDLKKGFDALGIESYAAILEAHNITANEVDEIIERKNFLTKLPLRPNRLKDFLRYGLRRRALLRETAKSCDVFIFVWQSFLTDASDLEFLKKLGKKIVVFFMGSEQRWKNAYEQEMSSFGISSYYSRFSPYDYQFSLKALSEKLRYLRYVEKYADVIYSLPNQSQLSLRPYHHFYIPVNTQIIAEKTEQRKVPLIVHAPTKRAVKGTDIVLETFERLKNIGIKFEARLIENIPYREALKIYSEADIVIGELFIPSGGKLDREALAAGKVVLSSVRRDYIDNLPPDCPIIDVNPTNLYEELKKIIPDHRQRSELAKKGRAFVEKRHDIEVVCRDVLDKLENSLSAEIFDFFPTFFRDKFLPESPQHAKLYNHWTKIVSGENWYKKHVPAGKRDRLIF